MNQQKSRKINVLEYLKNPYHLMALPDKFELTQNMKSLTRTNQRRFYRPYQHKTVLPELNSTNALYLSKTSQQFRKSRKEWQEELNMCLSSQSIKNIPNKSKLTSPIKSMHTTTSSTFFRKVQPEMHPLLEIQAQKLLCK